MSASYFWTADRGFLLPGLHDIPFDAIEVSMSEHAALLDAQSRGGRIEADEDGYPVAIMPPSVPALDAARATALAAVRAAFDGRIAAGMPWQGKVLQIDAVSTGLLTSAYAMAGAGGLPAGFGWRMLDNTFLPMDAEGLGAMALAAGAYVYQLRATAWQHTDAIRAAETVEEIEAIDISSGWWSTASEA